MLQVCIHFTNRSGIVKKILAYLFMICGVTAYFFDGILPICVLFPLQILGYISMPFFAQAVVEGFFLTKNIYKYFLRISLTAYLAQAAFLLVYLLWDSSPKPLRLNIVFTWMITLSILFAVELLVSLPRDRVASMNLIEPNASSQSTRYGVIVSSAEANNLPHGMKIPELPRTTLHGFAILLFAICMVLVTFLPLTMSLMSIMCVLMFYFLHRWKIDNRVFVATVFFAAFAACYTYLYFRMTGIITWEGISLIGFFLCLLLPSKKRKKSKWFYRAFYLFYPLTIAVCAIASYLVS